MGSRSSFRGAVGRQRHRIPELLLPARPATRPPARAHQLAAHMVKAGAAARPDPLARRRGRQPLRVRPPHPRRHRDRRVRAQRPAPPGSRRWAAPRADGRLELSLRLNNLFDADVRHAGRSGAPAGRDRPGRAHRVGRAAVPVLAHAADARTLVTLPLRGLALALLGSRLGGRRVPGGGPGGRRSRSRSRSRILVKILNFDRKLAGARPGAGSSSACSSRVATAPRRTSRTKCAATPSFAAGALGAMPGAWRSTSTRPCDLRAQRSLRESVRCST